MKPHILQDALRGWMSLPCLCAKREGQEKGKEEGKEEKKGEGQERD